VNRRIGFLAQSIHLANLADSVAETNLIGLSDENVVLAGPFFSVLDEIHSLFDDALLWPRPPDTAPVLPAAAADRPYSAMDAFTMPLDPPVAPGLPQDGRIEGMDSPWWGLLSAHASTDGISAAEEQTS